MKDRIARIFYNREELRIRAGWRILLFMPILIGAAFALESLIELIFGGLPEDQTLKMLVGIAMVAFVGTVATLIARRFFDKKTLLSFGLRLDTRAVKDWLFGFFLSAIMVAVVFLVQLWTGLLSYEGINPAFGTGAFMLDFLLMFITYCILVAWWEELVFRGYLLQNMMDGMGKLWAVIISCLFYGLIHSTNPNAGILSSAIIVLFGYLRLYGYLETSQLWLSMGMHAAWNFFQGPVFGFAASGFKTRTILVHSPNGPDWLTGGNFGPEGSLITVPVVVLALAAMYWWSRDQSSVPDPRLGTEASANIVEQEIED